MQNTQELSLASNLTRITFQQQIVQPQIKLTHIQSNHYFMLIHKKTGKALTYKQSNYYYQQHAQLADINQNDLNQIFLIQEIQTDKFQIVHGRSTLVFTRKTAQVMLDFGNWKSNQFFYTQKINNQNNKLQYWIKQNKTSNKYLYYDGFALRCQNTSPEDQRAIWQIRLCLHNKSLNKTSWIEYMFSNQVIDIPGASEEQGKELIQYPCNYRFNQRFYIEQCREEMKPSNFKQKLFTMQSLKTSQYITVKQGPFSTIVVQETFKKKVFPLKQLWKFEYYGNGLYIIKSALGSKMYLIVKNRSTKNEQVLAISQDQSLCLWKIVGNFNIMPNKDFKF